MDPRLLQLYIQELAHVRDNAAEFAARFPKIASRLAMDSTEVQDPYVERLLEGFAFLTARIQLRLNEGFPRFTEQLLERLSPNFKAPVPSMGVIQLNPDNTDFELTKGVELRAGTVLQSQVLKGVKTPCKFKVGHSITLWPLAINSIAHGSFNCMASNVPGIQTIRSALTVTIQATAQLKLSDLPVDSLDFHVSCSDENAYTLFDRVCYQSVAVGLRVQGESNWQFLPASHVQPLGLDDEQALLPICANQLSGLRLLQEFFACPSRFLFFRIQGLKRFFRSCDHSAFEFALCFNDRHPELDRVLGLDSLALNCTPVVNLFEQNCDRLLLDERLHEVQVLVDRSKPRDYEVHSVLSVNGYGHNKTQEVPSLYGQCSESNSDLPRFVNWREPTRMSEKQAREGGRSTYQGSDFYLGLTLPTGEIMHAHGFVQLAVKALCTNRDLPLLMPVGQGVTDLVWPGNLPLKSVRFLRGPSRPMAAIHSGKSCWQLIEHLSLNYLGLIEQNQSNGTSAIHQLLTLHADPSQQSHLQIAGAVQAVESQPMVARISRQGKPALARGLQVSLTLNELAMQGTGVAVLGSVLARCLAAHVSVNSFVQTRVHVLGTGAVFEFPARSGNRPLL